MQLPNEVADEVRVSQAQQPLQSMPRIIGQYKMGKTLGKGTFGKVKQAEHIPTGEKVAIKIIDKNTIQDQDDKQRILREVQIMKTCRHPNIIHLYQIIETDKQIYLVLQYAEQGQLFKLMSNQGRLKQKAAGRIFLQIINAVQYLHRLDIVHRDLKPQNILLDVDFNIKLIDYGLSNYHHDAILLNTACGSPCYAPPEMLSGNDYDGKVGDVWSLGIIFYGMVCGTLPFEEQNTKDLYQRVIQGFYYIPNDISIQAIQVIQKMLVTDPKKRITIAQLRKLRFFRQINKIEPEIIGIIVGYHPMPIDNEILDRMQQINPKDKKQIQFMIKQNEHNQLTTIYYLIQKQVLRQGGKTVVELQIFLQTHQKYKTQYGKQSLVQYFKQINKSKIKTNKQQVIITPRKSQLPTQRKRIDTISQHKIQRKGLSKQKYNKNQFKEQNPLKFFSNQRINRKVLTSSDTKNQKKFNSKVKVQKLQLTSVPKTRTITQRLYTERQQRANTFRNGSRQKAETQIIEFDKKQRSKSKSCTKFKKLVAKSPAKNLAINLWNAYFQDPLQKKISKQKKRKINPKQVQKMQNFDMNVKKLKQGFMHLPHMQRTRKLTFRKQETSTSSPFETTKKINFQTTKQT